MTEDKRVHRFWKWLSIILILFIIAIFFFLYTAAKAYEKDLKNEELCVMDICGENIYTSYYYDSYDKKCMCYDENGLALEKVMK